MDAGAHRGDALPSLENMSEDTNEPRKLYMPPEWRSVGIEEDGKRFNLVALVSRVAISKTDLQFYGLDPDLKVTGLTLAQAKKTGAAVETAAFSYLRGAKIAKK
jgi:hypothetical protein